jgi:hypothetical protein
MKTSKQKQVEDHLKAGKSITGIYALNMFNLYRLSSAINRLRNKGLNIKTDKSKGYAVYKLAS